MRAMQRHKTALLESYLLAFLLLIAFAVWLKNIRLESGRQEAGLVNFSLGAVMLMAYVGAQILKTARLPLLSGYILAGILAGPYVTGFLTETMVQRLRLVDDLALSFIALSAGGTLHLQFLIRRSKAILLNVILHALIVFGGVFLFVLFVGNSFSFTRYLSSFQITALAILLGVIAIARSPSSAIAIISECRAAGVFTETVMGVTVAIDVLIIIFFTIALAITRIVLAPGATMNYGALTALSLEMAMSVLLGIISGKGISVYIRRVGHDLPLFLLFFAFGVAKISLWLSHFMQGHFGISLHLEPLLICMSAGFTIQNFSTAGAEFKKGLDRVSLPIYILFFSLAGASLNLEALRATWTLAVCLVIVRSLGLFVGAWTAGTLSKDPPLHNRLAWMTYLTQAGVSIGLAQLANRNFPEIGIYLTTVVLAVITLNQFIGPVLFKAALNMVGETGQK